MLVEETYQTVDSPLVSGRIISASIINCIKKDFNVDKITRENSFDVGGVDYQLRALLSLELGLSMVPRLWKPLLKTVRQPTNRCNCVLRTF